VRDDHALTAGNPVSSSVLSVGTAPQKQNKEDTMSLAHFTFTPRFHRSFRDIDELFRTFTPETQTSAMPLADVLETDKAIEIQLDLPGVAPERIDVKLDGNQLSISAERAEEKDEGNKAWSRRERAWGHFSRTFTLPTTLDGTTPEATYRHGVLTVTLPKREEMQPRSLKVKVEA
jgi:HSP20 family protein